ncbi:MAG: RNA methyltransferase [Actinomycetaceae bacterium]|nr:RNA methyltransferase [Actinomycetaceae bacterium]
MDQTQLVITDPTTPKMRKVARLSGRSYRNKQGLIRVEGPQAVAELLRYAPDSIHDVYISEGATRPDVVMLALDTVQWVHNCTDKVVEAIAPGSQGIVAVADASIVAGVLAEALGGTGPVVLVPSVQDPGNAGTLIRLADAFGASGIVFCKGAADPTGPKVIRASVGSIFHLPVVSGLDFDSVVLALHGINIPILGTAGSGALSLPELCTQNSAVDLGQKHAWLFGNEAKGLTKHQLAACKAAVSIPMSGRAESLNIAAAASLCLYASQQVHSR